MNNNAKIGIFLCKCGQKIEPLVDLPALKKSVAGVDGVACCDILPYPCLEPGLNAINLKIQELGLNRIIVAGCESRLMLKKFEQKMEANGLQ
ncbi:MAG: hydrogenase iron-sulfur subunit, partial [Thermodesulfobacteriota bacterium]